MHTYTQLMHMKKRLITWVQLSIRHIMLLSETQCTVCFEFTL